MDPENGSGALIAETRQNLSGLGSTESMPIYGTYAATKAALRSYVRTWTAEFARRGIRANVISPGPIETPMFDAQFSTNALKEQFKANIPLHRLGLPEEIASAALFLASKESSYISGIDLPVDGGLVSV